MKIIPFGEKKYENSCVLLLGYFDAMHIGHRKLIADAKQIAIREGIETGLMTFTGAKKGGQVFVFEERLRLYRETGIDFVYPAEFNSEFRNMSGEEFLRQVTDQMNVKEFVCGEDYRYGKNAESGIKELSEFCKEKSIALYAERLVEYGGEKAAASEAKRLLDEGNVEALEKLLGGKYFISGNVSTEGRRVGTRIGFPTANIHPQVGKYPLRQGVYAVWAEIDGKKYKGIANYGARPTFEDMRIVLEIYFVGYEGNLYGKELTVYFDYFLRENRKFSCAEELQAQLKKDLEKLK